MNLLNVLLKTLLSSDSLSALIKKTGLSGKQLKTLIPLAIPLLLKFLTKNASSESGAQALLGALGQHTSQKSMAEQLGEADEEDGGKIVAHILGEDSDKAIGGLAAQSGLSSAQVNKALSGIAPALLSSLSSATGAAAKKVDLSDGLDLSELMVLLGGKGQSQSGGLLAGLFGRRPKEEADSSANGTALLGILSSLMK